MLLNHGACLRASHENPIGSYLAPRGSYAPPSINPCGWEHECLYTGVSHGETQGKYIPLCLCTWNKMRKHMLFLQKGTLSKKVNTRFQSENKTKPISASASCQCLSPSHSPCAMYLRITNHVIQQNSARLR